MASNIKFYDDVHELWENSKIWRDYTSGFGNTPYEFFTSIGFTFSGQNPLFQWEDGHRYFNNGANPIVLGGNGPRIVCCKLTKRGDATATEKYWVDLSNNTITIPTGKHYIDECNILYDPLQLYLANNSTYFAHLEVGTNTTNTEGVGFTRGSVTNVGYNGLTSDREIYSTSHYNLKTNSGTYNVRSIGKSGDIPGGDDNTPYQFKVGTSSYNKKPVKFGYIDEVRNHLFPLVTLQEKDETGKTVGQIEFQMIDNKKAALITYTDYSLRYIYFPDDAEIYRYTRSSPYYRGAQNISVAVGDFSLDAVDNPSTSSEPYTHSSPLILSMWGGNTSPTKTISFSISYVSLMSCYKYNFSTSVWTPVTSNRPGIVSRTSQYNFTKGRIKGDFRPDKEIYNGGSTGAYTLTKANMGWATSKNNQKWEGSYTFRCGGMVEQNPWEPVFALNSSNLSLNITDNKFYLNYATVDSPQTFLEHYNEITGTTYRCYLPNAVRDTAHFRGTFNYTGVRGGFPAYFDFKPKTISCFGEGITISDSPDWVLCYDQTYNQTVKHQMYALARYVSERLVIDYAFEIMTKTGNTWIPKESNSFIRRHSVTLEDCYMSSSSTTYTSYAVATNQWMLDKSATPVSGGSSSSGGGGGGSGISIVDANDPVNP